MTSTYSTSPATSPVTDTNNSTTTLIIVVSIGGVIITASIIIIIVVAVFVRKSTRELKQQTQNRLQGSRPAHASSVRTAPGQQSVGSVRVQPEAQKEVENEHKKPDEIQGFYAVIPRSEDLGASADGQRESGGKGIVYAALEFDDVDGKPEKASTDAGKASGEAGGRPLTGPCVVVAASQPDTYVEMEPLSATVRNDSASVECYPDGEGIYELAKDPNVDAQTSTGQTNVGMNQNMLVGARNNEMLLQTLV